jgi:hypothetical protein
MVMDLIAGQRSLSGLLALLHRRHPAFKGNGRFMPFWWPVVQLRLLLWATVTAWNLAEPPRFG